MITSCGFLIQSLDKYLLCHSTHPKKTAKRYDGRWGISKGGQEKNETFLETAKRETIEEIGLDVDSFDFKISKNYYSYVYKSKKKRLFIYKVLDVKGLLVDFPFHCDSMVDNEYREIDSFTWVDDKEIKDIIMTSQRPIIDIEEDYWRF